jgi:hypothetical protein
MSELSDIAWPCSGLQALRRYRPGSGPMQIAWPEPKQDQCLGPAGLCYRQLELDCEEQLELALGVLASQPGRGGMQPGCLACSPTDQAAENLSLPGPVPPRRELGAAAERGLQKLMRTGLCSQS